MAHGDGARPPDGQDFQQIVVGQEEKSWKGEALHLQIVVQPLSFDALAPCSHGGTTSIKSWKRSKNHVAMVVPLQQPMADDNRKTGGTVVLLRQPAADD